MASFSLFICAISDLIFSAVANESAMVCSRLRKPPRIEGHANFLRMKNTTRNARSVQIINPKPGVSSCIKKRNPSPKGVFRNTPIEEDNFINSILLNNVQNVEVSDTCLPAGRQQKLN